jgi:hypothetical protein
MIIIINILTLTEFIKLIFEYIVQKKYLRIIFRHLLNRTCFIHTFTKYLRIFSKAYSTIFEEKKQEIFIVQSNN